MAALADVRLVLLGLGLLLIAGIWWWGARRSHQATGRSELREPTVGLSDDAAPREPAPMFETFASESGSRDWGVPPFEPLSIRTAEFEQVPVMDLPVMTNADMLEATHPASTRDDGAPAAPEPSLEFEPLTEPARAPPPVAAPAERSAPSANLETQRIVTIRVVAGDEAGWSGVQLLAALDEHGFAHGRYQVFHRKHSDGRTLLCAASLVEPGTFDLARMAHEKYRGLTLFAVLPGPLEPTQMFDILFATAHDLAQQMHGAVQDAKGQPLTAQRAAELREDVAHFQALLN